MIFSVNELLKQERICFKSSTLSIKICFYFVFINMADKNDVTNSFYYRSAFYPHEVALKSASNNASYKTVMNWENCVLVSDWLTFQQSY